MKDEDLEGRLQEGVQLIERSATFLFAVMGALNGYEIGGELVAYARTPKSADLLTMIAYYHPDTTKVVTMIIGANIGMYAANLFNLLPRAFRRRKK